MVADLKIMQIFGVVGTILGVEAWMLVDASGAIASGGGGVGFASLADGSRVRLPMRSVPSI